MSQYPTPEGATGSCGFCHTSHLGRPCGTEDRIIRGKGETQVEAKGIGRNGCWKCHGTGKVPASASQADEDCPECLRHLEFKKDWDRFYEKCLTFACPHCNAAKGDPCQDTNLRKTKPHSRRQEEVRRARWEWEALKTAPCPTCKGTGRVKVVGEDKTHTVQRGPERLIAHETEER